MSETPTTHFGYRDVPEADKAKLVGEVFTSVARNYDVMNDLMSLGVHRLWKRYFVATSGVREGDAVLDLAGGTGDIATRIARASAGASVVVGDINPNMLAEGERRAEKAGLSSRLSFVEANAEELPFGKAGFDAVTIAFGIRNVPRIEVALSEAYRVLKRGGRLLVLEFSEVELPLLDKVYDAWSFNAIPKFGKAITGDAEPYQYLVESIRKFPNQENFAAMIRGAGFSRVSYTNYTGGIAALHSGWKL